MGPRKADDRKASPYECGFEAFEDARMQFDVRYYLIAILFIIFDPEIAFLFPWAVVFKQIGIVALVEMGDVPAVAAFGICILLEEGRAGMGMTLIEASARRTLYPHSLPPRTRGRERVESRCARRFS